MPELPEVETYRRKLEKVLTGKTVKSVNASPDAIVFVGRSPLKVKKALLGTKIKKCRRKGKYVWFETDRSLWPVFHLGMTGSYVICKTMPEKAKPIKLVLEMSDGTFMVFRDPRRFGRIFFFEDPFSKPPLSALGPDVFEELPSANTLRKQLNVKKTPIKAALLDQGFLAGIGNWMADEILFQSGISPKRSCLSLSPAEVKRLHQKIKSVTATSIKLGADSDRYPKRWIFHHRRGKKGEAVSSGEAIRFDEVGGRTTAWVPELQH